MSVPIPYIAGTPSTGTRLRATSPLYPVQKS